MSLIEKTICPDCMEEVEILKENGLCPTCSRRKAIMKEKYIAIKSLSEKDRKRILKLRESSKKLYNKNKKEEKPQEIKEIKSRNRNEELHKELEKEILENLENAYKKLNVEEDVEMDVVTDLNNVLNVINTLTYYDAKKAEDQKQLVTKKIDIIDKYMIDIQHNIEHKDFDDDEGLLLEAKKQNILRDIRRKLKDKEKSLTISKKFFKTINRDLTRLGDIKKDITGFMKSMEVEMYNPYVENPKSDIKILGLHKYRCECQITSSTTNRKVIKISEIIHGKNPDNVKDELIKILRNRYGQDVIWTNITTHFIR